MGKSWMTKRKELQELIRKVSDKYGGDDVEFLKEYTQDVLNDCAADYDRAIRCFESLLE
jgi:hypothetical protein